MAPTGESLSREQIQAELLGIMAEVLGEDIPPVPPETPILDFGVSSLALVEAMRRVYERFGVLISIRRVIEGQATLASITGHIKQVLDTQEARSAAPAPAPAPLAAPDLPPARHVRLAPSQRHVGFLTRYAPEASAAFNEAVAVSLEGPLDAPAMQAAVDYVAARYEALQTTFSGDRDELIIQPGQPPELAVAACPPEALEARLRESMSRPLLPGERLFRAELLRLAERRHVLVLVGHALLVEPEALHIVLAELAAAYTAFAADRDPVDAFPALQWSDYLALGEAEAAVEARQAAQAFWRERLTPDWPRLELPTDRPRPPIKRYAGARACRRLGPDLAARLRAWAAAHALSPADVVRAAYGLYLSRLAGAPDLAVGVRSSPLYLDGGQPAVAQTRNLLPVRFTVDPQASFAQHVQAQAAAAAQAERHRHYALAEMIQWLNLPRDQSRSALFTAGFEQRPASITPAFGGLQAALAPRPAPGARYDLNLIVTPAEGGLELACDYSTELFAPETAARWLRGLEALLEAALAAPETACGWLPLMPEAERHTLLVEWNQSERPYPADKTVLDLFLAQAQAAPHAPAVRCDNTVWTYRQLAERVEALAGVLAERGVAPGDRVAVLLERSPDLLAALLAAWRVGALYVPLDASFPPKRLAYMLDDAGVSAVLTSGSLAHLLGADYASCAVRVEQAAGALAAPLPPALQAARADASAYIIYTSGSTGQPKGVEVGHRGLVNCLSCVQRAIGFGQGQSLLAVTTVAFDISTVELFVPLLVGGQVDIVPDGVAADGLRLAEMMAAHNPDFMQATPSTWKTLLAAGWRGDPRLIGGAAGESLGRELVEQLLARCRAFWNLYGPTETTVYSAAGRVASDPGQPVPIGRPLDNTQLFILDDQLQVVPLGAVGELYIGGDGVARGYWRRPELTLSRFIPSPFKPGERLYRTGDLARYRPNGEVLCLGRGDDQVKIHGVRVELGEVEAALRQVAGVKDAVATAWRDARGDLQLVAHVIPAADPGPSVAEVRASLRGLLPEVMIPPYILFSQAFPLTSSGKIRRAALPAPDSAAPGPDRPAEMPETPTERLLAEAWARVLRIDAARIGRDADFLDLGGHSLLMTPLRLEVRHLFQVNFSLREFFAASSLRALARLIDERRREFADDGAPARAPGGNGQAGRARPAAPAPEDVRQRMAFLQREAQLPAGLAPARGLLYQPGPLNTVLLTGGTGFLGAYLVAEILQTTPARLFCLVRPRRGQAARDRLEAQLRRHAVWREDESWRAAWEARVRVVEGDVTLPRLGLPDDLYETLAREADGVLHGAAHVNFIYPYEALRANNVLSLHEVIRFAFHRRIKPVHHLSTAAIWPMGAHQTFYERDSIEHGQALNLGYDEAKWVGERCLLHAAERGLPVARYRPGEVGGDSLTGRTVTDHFVAAIIKGCLEFGAFPALDMELDIAPIDYVARAMTHLAFRRQPLGRAFHLTNPGRLHLRQALEFLRGRGYRFDELPFPELRDRLLDSPRFASNALFAYQAILEDMEAVNLELPIYDTTVTQRELRGSGIACPPADEALFGRYLGFLQDAGFMPRPEALLTPA
jgi:myxalamid-type nonribosomal peptide synthetase MxaA